MLNRQVINWKGEIFINELYKYNKGLTLTPLTQVQAVTFNSEGKIVLYKHIDGYYGFPGGKIEKGENAEEALIREVREELNAGIVNFGVFAFVKSYKKGNPNGITYNLRYWAIVNAKKEGVVNDPAGKSFYRVIISIQKASQLLNWGKMGKILIKEARKEFSKFSDK